MTEQILVVSRQWLSLIRFSVRGLSLLVLLIGIWLRWIVQRAHIQRDAVAAIRQAGGRVVYDWEWNNNFPVPNARPRAPAWLVDLIGIEDFGHAVHVILTDTGSDGLLIHVGRLNGLDYLKLDGSPVTDAGLVHLNRLSNIRTLSLQGTKVTGAGLTHLRFLSSLERLILSDTLLWDAGLAHVGKLKQLKVLKLDRTQITDAGLHHLNDLTGLGS